MKYYFLYLGVHSYASIGLLLVWPNRAFKVTWETYYVIKKRWFRRNIMGTTYNVGYIYGRPAVHFKWYHGNTVDAGLGLQANAAYHKIEEKVGFGASWQWREKWFDYDRVVGKVS